MSAASEELTEWRPARFALRERVKFIGAELA